MRILGIETSCDETAAAVLEFRDTKIHGYEDTRGTLTKILSNVVHSQVATHRKTGGVVPEVAAREHAEKIIPVIEAAVRPLRQPVDAIAVTYGPGLITSLLVGVETARTLSWAWNVPVVAVNHMEGHISVAMLQKKGIGYRVQGLGEKTIDPIGYSLSSILYPALALVVSGGHTELVLMKKPLRYRIIGATRDDAVGEAFDKVAKILGLQYPGGPIVSKLAERGSPEVFPFNPPMIKSPDYDFSFSGIKTAVLYAVKKQGTVNKKQRNDMCASFQKAVVDVLVAKTIRAVKEYGIKTVILAGGVAANKQLREQLQHSTQQLDPVPCLLIPDHCFCTDNAVMIAIAGYFHALKKEFTHWKKLDADPNLVLGS